MGQSAQFMLEISYVNYCYLKIQMLPRSNLQDDVIESDKRTIRLRCQRQRSVAQM